MPGLLEQLEPVAGDRRGERPADLDVHDPVCVAGQHVLDDVLAQSFAPLDDEERQTFGALLDRLLAADPTA